MMGAGACSSENCACGVSTKKSIQNDVCPQCGSQAHLVSRAVLENILRAEALQKYQGMQAHICFNHSCAVSYFDNSSDVTFSMDDCQIGIWFKEKAKDSYICYCEKIAEEEIITAVVETGLDDLASVMLYLRSKGAEHCESCQAAGLPCNRYFQEVIDKAVNVRETIQKYSHLTLDSKAIPYDLIEGRYNNYLRARGELVSADSGCGKKSSSCCGGSCGSGQ